MISNQADWRAYNKPLLLICVFACCCYLPSLFATFYADDGLYLAFTNTTLRNTSWRDLGSFFLGPTNPWEYLPIRDLSYWLDFQLYEVEGVGFHLTNLLWYFCSALAAWWLFRELALLCRTVATESASALALLGTAIFIAHPTHVEAVAWVASRKDLIGGALGLMSVALTAMALRRQWRWEAWLIVGTLLFIASLGKATAVIQVLMISLVFLAHSDIAKNGRVARAQIGAALGFFLVLGLAALAAFLHYVVAGTTGIRLVNKIGAMEMVERASRILAKLIEMLMAPYPLGFYHDVYAIGTWHWAIFVVGVGVFVLAVIKLLVRPRLWAFGVVQIVVSVLLYLQFVPFSTWSLASERFLFLSVAGFAMIAMDIAATSLQPRQALYLLAGVVFCYSTIVLIRLGDWKQVDRLVSSELVRVPEFHNAKRDQIVYRLLPEEKHDESVAVAKTFSKGYIRDLVLAFVTFEVEIRQFRKLEGNEANRTVVCERRAALVLALKEAQVRIVFETDLSLNNILRGVERSLPDRGLFSALACRAYR